MLSKYIEGIKTECYSKFKKKNTSLGIWAKLPILGPKIGALPGTCRAWDHPHLKEKPKRKWLKKKIWKGPPLQGTLSPMESREHSPQWISLGLSPPSGLVFIITKKTQNAEEENNISKISKKFSWSWIRSWILKN